jgi:hypothetical protein
MLRTVILSSLLLACSSGSIDAAAPDSGAPVEDTATTIDSTPAEDAPAIDSAPPPLPDKNCPGEAAPEVPAAKRTFYIDAAKGDDGADGKTAATAWKTLTKANSAAQPGDLYLLSGKFDRGIVPQVSGTVEAKIVFRAAPTASIVDADGYGVYVYGGRGHIVVDGVEITGTSSPFAVLGGHDVWLRNVNIHDNGGSGKLLDKAEGNRIEDSVITGCGTNGSNTWCLNIGDGASRNVITRSKIGTSGSTAIWMHANAAAPGEENVISYNDIANDWAQNILLIGGSRKTLVECNRIRNAGIAAKEGYYVPSFQIQSDDNVVRYNLVYDNKLEAISFWSYGDETSTSDARRNHVYGNTIFRNGGPAIRILQKGSSKIGDNIIENNIIWGGNKVRDSHWFSNDTDWKIVVDMWHVQPPFTPWPAGSFNGNIIRNNIIGKDGADVGKGWLNIFNYTSGKRYTLTEAQAAFPEALIGNLEVDPQFVDEKANDFHAAPSSPARDKGRPIEGRPFVGSAPDIGRYEQ